MFDITCWPLRPILFQSPREPIPSAFFAVIHSVHARHPLSPEAYSPARVCRDVWLGVIGVF
jgi:hypothetical protein